MGDSELPSPSIAAVPAADVTAPPVDTGSVVHQSYPLRQPEEDATEILVRVRGTTLRRVRKRLAILISGRFPWPELLLGLATLSLGCSFGGLASGVPWAVIKSGVAAPSSRALLFYVLFPILGVGSLVGYFCLRHFGGQAASAIAQDLLDELPDPDRAR